LKASLALLGCLVFAGASAQPADTLKPVWQLALRHEATHLAIDEERNVILLDAPHNRVYKYLRFFSYDSVMAMGGPGVQGEGFSQPLNLRVPNRNTIMLLDYNNRRLVLLNTNLRVIRDHDFEEQAVPTAESAAPVFLFPLAFDVGPVGEWFVLNNDDYRIYKYDQYGRFENVFGGSNYGDGRLLSPTDVRTNRDNLLYMPDTLHRTIVVYDNYGVYQYSLQPQLPFAWRQLRPWPPALVLFDSTQLALYDPRSQTVSVPDMRAQIARHGPILDVDPRKEGVYVLFKKAVILYSF
jgi:hypothetical protein